MFDGNGPGLPNKLDPRMAGGVVVLAIVVVLTIVADRAVFVQPPRNLFEQIMALLPAFAFWILEDRIAAAVATALILALVVVGVGFLIWRIIEIKVIEPIHIRNAIERTAREERLKNRYSKPNH